MTAASLGLRTLLIGATIAAAVGCQGESSGPFRTACQNCNVLLITMDTVRADRLPCYGHDRDTAPNVCGLASEGAIFTNAISQSAWTLPAHASMMTGLYPHEHDAEKRSTPIEEESPRLAAILQRNGYATGAIVSYRFVGANYGFDQGFQYFDASLDKRGNDHSYASEITDKAVSWLDEQEDPFFLWLHYFDPHHAYLHHDGGLDYAVEGIDGVELSYAGWNSHPSRILDYAEENEEALRSLYDGEIHYTDRHIGRLLEHLRNTARFQNTMVVVTSDHGEAFGEHQHVGHGKLLYQELIRVPLIFRVPGYQERRVVDNPQETKDIFHTVLSLLEIDVPATTGYDLLLDRRAYAYSEVDHRMPYKRVAVVNENWKMIYTLDGTVELYDLSQDPMESTNIAEKNPSVVKTLLQRMSEDLDLVVMDEEALDSLRSLGYVD